MSGFQSLFTSSWYTPAFLCYQAVCIIIGYGDHAISEKQALQIGDSKGWNKLVTI